MFCLNADEVLRLVAATDAAWPGRGYGTLVEFAA